LRPQNADCSTGSQPKAAIGQRVARDFRLDGVGVSCSRAPAGSLGDEYSIRLRFSRSYAGCVLRMAPMEDASATGFTFALGTAAVRSQRAAAATGMGHRAAQWRLDRKSTRL